MKRLKLFEHIEAKVSDYRVPERMRRVSVVPFDGPVEDLRFTARRIVDYRVYAGARVTVDDNAPAIEAGKAKVAKMLARHMFADIRDELIDLEEWIYQEGIGKDVCQRVNRLINLVSGDAVPPQEENSQ